jgi:hypothetical protein
MAISNFQYEIANPAGELRSECGPKRRRKNLKVRRMESKEHLWRAARMGTAAAAVALAGATVWDLARLARVQVWPAVSYVLTAAAIGAACAGVLLRVLTRRPARARNTIELAVIGLVLLAWWLRGHPAIPADPPLVGAEFLAALVLGGSAGFRRA